MLSVLLIDDNDMNQKFMKNVVAKLRYRLTAFSSGETAIEYLKNRKKEFDIIITDGNMPGKNGPEVLEILFSHWKNFPNSAIPLLLTWTDCEILRAEFERVFETENYSIFKHLDKEGPRNPNKLVNQLKEFSSNLLETMINAQEVIPQLTLAVSSMAFNTSPLFSPIPSLPNPPIEDETENDRGVVARG